MKPDHIIYYRSAKVGSSSIIKAIQKSKYKSIHLNSKTDIDSINLEDYQIIIVGVAPKFHPSVQGSQFDIIQEHISKLTNYTSFAVCRDPYTKFLSGVNYCYSRGTFTVDNFNSIIESNEYISPDDTELNAHDYGHILRPQTACLYSNDTQHAETIIKFENLNANVTQFFKKNGFDITLSDRSNVTKSQKFNRCKLVEQFVNKQFSVDFNNFNYQRIVI